MNTKIVLVKLPTAVSVLTFQNSVLNVHFHT